MDLLRKLTEDLEPLGGALLVDQFLEARRAAASAPAPRAARRPAAGAAPGPVQPETADAGPAPKAAPRAESVRVASLKPEGSGQEGGELSDTGRLRLEVEAFMNRDEAEGTDDSEVQEFLKDRSGFDPTEV